MVAMYLTCVDMDNHDVDEYENNCIQFPYVCNDETDNYEKYEKDIDEYFWHIVNHPSMEDEEASDWIIQGTYRFRL